MLVRGQGPWEMTTDTCDGLGLAELWCWFQDTETLGSDTGVFVGMLGVVGTSGVVTTRGTRGSERLHFICCFRTGSVLGSCHTAPLAGMLVSTLSTGVLVSRLDILCCG